MPIPRLPRALRPLAYVLAAGCLFLTAALPVAGAASAAGAPTAAASSAPAPAGSPVIKPFQCPEGGPNGGHAPQAMAKSAGHTLVLCADTESEEGRGIVATAVSVHEPASTTPGKPVFSRVDDVGHMRLEGSTERGFALTYESLLPRGTEYQWISVHGSDIACGENGCGERDRRCALELPSSEKRDLLGKVRQLSRSGVLEASVAQRLIDDLVVQALLGDDVAAWAVDHLDRILTMGADGRDPLAQARRLLEEARAAGCDTLVPPPDGPPPPPPDSAALAAELKERIARSRKGSAPPPVSSASSPPPADLDAVAWLVGGRWEGKGTMPDGGVIQVEETYRWGPARRSIRFRAQNAGSQGKNGSAIEGILFFESKAGKIVLWNVKPGGGLSESLVTRADHSGCEFEGADGRVRMGRQAGDHQTRVVDRLQEGTWTTVVNATYERHAL
jgi:hypothetical protein